MAADELAKLEAQLADQSFLTRAPAAVVARVRERAAKLRSNEQQPGVPCPGCGTPMREYRGDYWCPRYRALSVIERFYNIECRHVWRED